MQQIVNAYGAAMAGPEHRLVDPGVGEPAAPPSGSSTFMLRRRNPPREKVMRRIEQPVVVGRRQRPLGLAGVGVDGVGNFPRIVVGEINLRHPFLCGRRELAFVLRTGTAVVKFDVRSEVTRHHSVQLWSIEDAHIKTGDVSLALPKQVWLCRTRDTAC